MFAILAACVPAATDTPVSIPAPPTLTPTLAFLPTPTSVPWQAPAEWWTKSQVSAFSSPLFASYFLPDNQVHNSDYFLDVYSRTGVTFLNWNDARAVDNWREMYPEIIAELHARHYIVVGTISMIQWLTDRASIQELQPAIMRDPYGNAIEDNGCLPEIPCNFSVLSVIHPTAQNYYLSVVKTYIDAGVDGIMIDELAYGTVFSPDFNENTMLEFRQYLLDIYSSEELAAFGQQYRISDFTTLDYAALVRASLPADRTSLWRQDWQWDLYSQTPFFLDYQRFVRLKNHEFAQWIINEGKAYAMEKYGREIPFSANINTLTAPEALYLIDSLDYVDLEYFYQPQGYFPRGRALTAVRTAQAFGKQPYLVTSYAGTDSDIAARGTEKSTNLFRLMIAEAYGTGAAFAVEEGLHGIKQDINALAPYYRFSREYPYLFEGMTPLKGQIGLLYLMEDEDVYNRTDLRGLGQMLADSGYQFKIIFGSEEFMSWGTINIYPAPEHPLTLEELSSYSLIIVPEMGDMIPSHTVVLLQYVKQGGKVVIFTTPEHTTNLTYNRGQTEPSVAELLGYMRAGNAAVGQGRIITVDELWGRPYATDPQPAMRQPLEDLLAGDNILPEVSMSPVNYVGAFMNQSPDSLTVHFVNYDYDPETDQVAPIGSVEVMLTLPDGFDANNLTIHYYSPGEESQTLTGNLNGNHLSLSLPGINIWSVIGIGNEDVLQAEIAVHSTTPPSAQHRLQRTAASPLARRRVLPGMTR